MCSNIIFNKITLDIHVALKATYNSFFVFTFIVMQNANTNAVSNVLTTYYTITKLEKY